MICIHTYYHTYKVAIDRQLGLCVCDSTLYYRHIYIYIELCTTCACSSIPHFKCEYFINGLSNCRLVLNATPLVMSLILPWTKWTTTILTKTIRISLHCGLQESFNCQESFKDHRNKCEWAVFYIFCCAQASSAI